MEDEMTFKEVIKTAIDYETGQQVFKTDGNN